MIELYKIFAGKYDNNTTEWIGTTTGKCIEKQRDTRNHIFALQQSHVHYDMRKFSFYIRTIPTWNSLPDCLDKFWENQDVRYNCQADISFTGSRSKVELTID